MVTKNGKNGNGAGRPPAPINWEEVQRLARIQCTDDEIAFVMGFSRYKLQHRCISDNACHLGEYLKRYQAGGRESLRRKQFEIADKGNTTMLIWLGKQYLGQREPLSQHQLTTDSAMPLAVRVEIANSDSAKPFKEISQT